MNSIARGAIVASLLFGGAAYAETVLPFEDPYIAVITKNSKPHQIAVGEAIESQSGLNVESVKRAYDDFAKCEGYDIDKYAPLMEQLIALGDHGDFDTRAALSRQILLSNPLLDSDKILVARYNLGDRALEAMAPSLGTQRNNWSNQSSAVRSGFDAEIAVISDLRSDEVKIDQIYKHHTTSSIADLHLNWDGERVMFTATDERNMWCVYEVNTDGSGLHKVIKNDEPDLEFFDGAYLPSGNIVAVSNIGYQGVPCVNGVDQVGNLVAYDIESETLRRMTFDQDANWHPRVMNNGKLTYVRWEYTDLTHYYSRFVMHSAPDGTETKALYGSGGWFPNSVFDIEPIPNGSSSFVGIITGHHGVPHSGRLIVFDPAKGRKEVAGMVQELPFSKREIVPEVKDGLVNGVWPQFVKPYPLSDKYFLVSAKMTPTSLWSIYLIDIYDNVTLLASEPSMGFVSPILLEPREVPPVIPDRIDLTKKEATFFIQDIYEGEGLPNVPRGTIERLRVFAYEYAYTNSRSNHAGQGIQSGWDIKRLLGEVEVEEDGSVMFKAPANTPISMQPLDSEGRAVQWMRSWVTGMPGESVSCVGCHEDQSTVPIPKRVIASMNGAKSLSLGDDGDSRPFTYNLEIQPILDRACIACHNESSEMNLMKADYFEDPKRRPIGLQVSVISNDMGDVRYANQSYMNLHPYVNRQGSEADIYVMKPYEYHASTSELVKILKRGHHNVELTDAEWRKIYMWIDLNAPMHGYFLCNKNAMKHCPTNAYDRRIELANKYGNGAGVDWRREIDEYAALLESRGKIEPVTPPKSVEKRSKPVKLSGFPFSAEQAAAMVADGDTRKSIEIAEGVTIDFVKIPAGTFVMGCNGATDALSTPASKVKIDKEFWMATTELTNEQYNVIFPDHDSRYIAEFWKDHVDAGMPANQPTQPVIRVTWRKAMAFCEALSAKCGESITLPSEAQWEWACRAGSATPMWYGELGVDYGEYENMADTSLSKMAVSGINPQPMAENNYYYKYWNFLLRDWEATDGELTICKVGQYKPNAWGLFDMHGNVGEMTSSSFAPYPYDPDAVSEQRVYRGGSWITRSKNSTSYSRNEIYEWQQSNNVGFRIIIE